MTSFSEGGGKTPRAWLLVDQVPTTALILGGGGLIAILSGTLLPLAIALTIAVIAGGSGPVGPSAGDTVLGPPPEGATCDFCYQRPVEWAYPCRSFSVAIPQSSLDKIEIDLGHPMPDALKGINSMGAWAADEPCHTLIERNDWEGMFERYWNQSPSGRALRMVGFRQVHARDWTDALWAQFRLNRLGPPVRVGPFGLVPSPPSDLYV